MVTAMSTDIVRHRRWFRAAAGGMALGVLVSLVGAAVGLFSSRVECNLPAPTQLVLGVWVVLAGGCLQMIPLGVALSARRRWRTTLALGCGLLLFGLLAIVANASPLSLRGVIDPEAAVAVVPGVAGIALGTWLEGRATTPPRLTVLEANAFTVGAIALFVASWNAAIGVGMVHFCLTF